jgi:hypothetical protein
MSILGHHFYLLTEELEAGIVCQDALVEPFDSHIPLAPSLIERA